MIYKKTVFDEDFHENSDFHFVAYRIGNGGKGWVPAILFFRLQIWILIKLYCRALVLCALVNSIDLFGNSV